MLSLTQYNLTVQNCGLKHHSFVLLSTTPNLTPAPPDTEAQNIKKTDMQNFSDLRVLFPSEQLWPAFSGDHQSEAG